MQSRIRSHFMSLREQLPKISMKMKQEEPKNEEKKEIPIKPVLERQNTLMSTKDGSVITNGNTNGLRLFDNEEDIPMVIEQLEFCSKCFDFACDCSIVV